MPKVSQKIIERSYTVPPCEDDIHRKYFKDIPIGEKRGMGRDVVPSKKGR